MRSVLSGRERGFFIYLGDAMAYVPYKLSDKEIKRLNQALVDADLIKQDIERAREAGVPNMDAFIEVCNGQMECIANLKKQFASKAK